MKMESILKIVKEATEAAYVKYDPTCLFEATKDVDTGVTTCIYIHPDDPQVTYIIAICENGNFLLSTVEHGYL